jgi:O-antigen/teichoic acid export membrane protein
LQSSNTYLVAQQSHLLSKLVTNSFWVSLIAGTGFTAITLSSFYFFYSNLQAGSFFVILLVPSIIFYLLGTNLLVGISQIKLFNFFQLSSNLLVVATMLIGGYLKLSSKGFIALSTFSWFATAIILLYTLTKLSAFSFKFDKHVFKTGFIYALKVYLATLFGLLVLKGNVFLLNKFCSEQVLGYFSIASQINDALAILPTSIGLLLFPRLVRNTANRWKETKRNLLITSLLMLAACLLAALLIKPFVLFVFGIHFAPSISILLWMLPGAFFLGVISIASQYLAAIGFPKQLIYLWFFAFILVSILSWLLIPAYGGIGAAAALSITYCILFCFIMALTYQQSRASNKGPVLQESLP